jgi:hypothetical protein
MTPLVHAFFDEATNTITYVVQEPEGRACAIVDSVLDFDYASGAPTRGRRMPSWPLSRTGG